MPTSRTRVAFLVMLMAPLFFSTNLVFGRGVTGDVAPFTLAFIRWAAVALVLLPFMMKQKDELFLVLRKNGFLIALLGFLGMWICGGVVYLGLGMTTATNGTLIYTTSPVIIILMEALRGRPIAAREAIGALIAFLGVAVILLKGDLSALLKFDFNLGDLLILGGAFAWAAYSILYRSPSLQRLSNLALFGIVAAAGAILLLPMALHEWATGAQMPVTQRAWMGIAGIVAFSSLLAFSFFQYGIRILGASISGIFMYLLPAYGVMLAVLLLGESLEGHHMAGIALVMGGIVLATLPAGRAKVGRAKKA
ncbi:DMT family transporter [Aquamicrobium sp. LC103]|uniref:DMT family transporter n=1 Tax=Aquamicrobium sp. LC103 TaxID=1120658 RepID=UPI00063ECA4C|nr:DMT family transporter [Aquamicrobium sp. LC103]TKT79409.1 DMT family transporter [Aquamicrobium sp. LC103]